MTNWKSILVLISPRARKESPTVLIEAEAILAFIKKNAQIFSEWKYLQLKAIPIRERTRANRRYGKGLTSNQNLPIP
jgi:hypothetical protein